jgi:2-polyprenyl-6-methoxyphenol hydroxylase-like FAD-dependent oxidoreductase
MITKNTTDQVDVLIVGAGPAGLMMATWMNACGIKTRIVDKRGTKVSCESKVSYRVQP